MRRRLFCNYRYIREKLSIRPRENRSLPPPYFYIIRISSIYSRLRAEYARSTFSLRKRDPIITGNRFDVSRPIRWVENR